MDKDEEIKLEIFPFDYYKFVVICKLLKDMDIDFEVVNKYNVNKDNITKNIGIGPLYGIDIEIVLNNKDIIPEIYKMWNNILPATRSEIVQGINKIIDNKIKENDELCLGKTIEEIFESGVH